MIIFSLLISILVSILIFLFFNRNNDIGLGGLAFILYSPIFVIPLAFVINKLFQTIWKPQPNNKEQYFFGIKVNSVFILGAYLIFGILMQVLVFGISNIHFDIGSIMFMVAIATIWPVILVFKLGTLMGF